MHKVMIVDDEIMVRIGMKAIINWEENGWTVTGDCSNGKEALEKIDVAEPDLVLTDLTMDGMDGFALMEACRQHHPRVKFIILSNYNDFENTKKAIRLGAIDYIFKLTITPEDLKDALKRAEAHITPEAEEGQQKKNLTAIRSYLMRTAVEGTYHDEESFLNDIRKVSPANDFSRAYCEMQISVDQPEGQTSADRSGGSSLPKFDLVNMLSEVMNRNGSAEVYSYYHEDCIIVFNTETIGDYEAVCAYAQKKFEIIREYVRRYFSLDVTGALSGIHTGIAELRKAVAETDQVLTYRSAAECKVLHTALDSRRSEIAEAVRYVQQHLDGEISLENAARRANMSQSYFSHIFKEEMNISFTDYVNRMRIQKACSLLKNPHLKVSDVALQVGIENFNYFSILFKKVTGLSPNAYREGLQKTE